MKLLTSISCALALLAASPARAAEPANFLFLDADDMADHRDLLARPDIAGGQIIYPWRQLEPRKDEYDFSKLEQDLAVARSLHKKLWVSIGDRTFSLKWKGIKIKITRVFNGIISIGFQATYWQKNAIRNKTTGNNSY